MTPATYRVGIDIGGTFTDVVFLDDDGNVITEKVASTPHDYAAGIESGLTALLGREQLSGSAIQEIIHGTTVATNTILELKGAHTGLITTSGFRDVLEIRRLRMPVLYDLRWRKPPPLVRRRCRTEVSERIDYLGNVITPLDLRSVERAVETVLAEGVEAIAVCLLNAYANPVHEQAVREVIAAAAPTMPVYLSSDVLPEIKEYERTSTTVVNAYIAPVVEQYLHSLEAVLERLAIDAPFLVMQSNGGAMGAHAAAEKPIHIIESGPAAGVVGAAEVAQRLGIGDVLSFDMGGTTAKASMIEQGRFDRVNELDVGAGINAGSRLLTGGGYLVRVPAIDIAEVGAGGGSLVRIDPGGALTVGPESAGADPGPVCYGKGNTTTTVTDANLALGYLNPNALVGGGLAIDRTLPLEVIERDLAGPLGVSMADAAYGVHAIANAAMSRALRAVSSERGRDPRQFTLIAFGGNGGVHAHSLAASMDMTRIVVPPAAGVFSALGLLFPETQHHYVRTFKRAVSDVDFGELDGVFSGLESDAAQALASEGYTRRISLERYADMRYAGENSELTVDAPPKHSLATLVESFHAAHERTYGYRSDEETVETVNLRLVATGHGDAPRVPRTLSMADMSAKPPPPREVYFGPELGWVRTEIVRRSDVPRDGADGPLVIEDYDATIVVPPGARASREAWELIAIKLAAPPAKEGTES